jgi:hypothetical protein
MTLRALGIATSLALTASPALACTICHSPTALGVRHLLLNHDLVRNAAAVASPLPLLLAAILGVAGRGGRGSEPRRE